MVELRNARAIWDSNSVCAALLYPFTAPIITPFTKYFWRKGYAHIIGRITAIMTAYRTCML